MTKRFGGRLAGRVALITGTAGGQGATVVGCDVVELSPLPGLMAPNFLCAKLVYKILAYRFAQELRR